MLEGLYIPSHSPSEDNYPDIAVAEKLRHIAEAELAVEPVRVPRLAISVEKNYYQAYFRDTFRKPIPYVKGLRFQLCESDDKTETSLDIETFDLGDEKLRGQGLGTRLLYKAIDYGLEQHDNLKTVTMRAANLAVVKTIGKVLGDEHVSFQRETAWGSPWYGEGHDKPLEAVIDDVPYEEGERYLFNEVRASVDPVVVAGLGESVVKASSA